MLLAIAVLVIIAEPADRLLRLDALLSRPDTRALASDWMLENLPPTAPLRFLHPLIFGRPPAASFYPNRLALPEGVTAQQISAAIREIAHRGWYFILDEHPLDYSYTPPELRGMVSREAKTVFTVDPFVPAARPAVFDPFDAFYVPIDGFDAVRLPGPAIRIYRIE
ncbi:MAG: hypothetical protein NTV79_05120 [Candidatus Aureabacteria bacterium]|nr:hypothetical protein [Candidatus Auribacterota bacterium]